MVGGFDEALQQYVSATLHQYRYRAFNPTLVTHQGMLWVLARVSNATNCRKEEEVGAVVVSLVLWVM